MNWKISSGILLLFALFIGAFLLWNKSTQISLSTIDQSGSVSKDTLIDTISQQPVLPTKSDASIGVSNEIHGQVVDTGGIPIPNSDIMYAVLPVDPLHDCLSITNILFELNSTTRILQSGTNGRFSIPVDNFSPNEVLNLCLFIEVANNHYRSESISLPLDLDNLPKIIEIELQKSTLISGTVKTPTNQLIANATIKAWTLKSSEENTHCSNDPTGNVFTSTSKSDGGFELYLEDEGQFCIQASHASWASSETETGLSDIRERKLELQLRRYTEIVGTVLDVQGAPVDNLSLQFTNTSENSAGSNKYVITDGNGQFTLNTLDYGNYQLKTLNSSFRISEPDYIKFNNENNNLALSVTVFPTTSITGRILNADGEVVENVSISSRSPYVIDKTISHAQSDKFGNFQLTSLHRSSNAHEHEKMASAFVSGVDPSLAYASADVVCLEFHHPNYQTKTMQVSTVDADLNLNTVVLDPANITISGVVVNHQNQAVEANLTFEKNAAIDVDKEEWRPRLPECKDTVPPRIIKTTGDGRFSLSFDSPGSYSLVVETNKYQPRNIELSITQSSDDFIVKLE